MVCEISCKYNNSHGRNACGYLCVIWFVMLRLFQRMYK